MIQALVPLALIVAVGYLATRAGLFRREEMATLSRFVITFALPALLVLALASRTPEELVQPTYLASYAVGLVVTLVAGIAWSRGVNRSEPVASVFDGMGGSCPNSGLVGFPVLLAATPASAGLALGLNMVVENLLVIPLALALLERARSGGLSWRQRTASTLRGIVSSPLILGIVVGVALSITRVALPAPLHRVVEAFAQATTAVSLFAVGGLLVGLSLGGRRVRVVTVVAVKLVVLPLVVWAAYLLLTRLGLPALEWPMLRALVVSAAMPTFVTYSMLAADAGDTDVPPAVLVLGTLLSFGSLGVVLELTAAWG